MTVLFLSCTLEIDWLHDGNRLVCLGPMMGIDGSDSINLIGLDWAHNKSKVEIKLMTFISQRIKR